MQYTGFSPTQEVQAFIDMSRSHDVFEFRQALTQFDVGSQNFGVADIHGNVAEHMNLPTIKYHERMARRLVMGQISFIWVSSFNFGFCKLQK